MTPCYVRHETAPGVHADIPHEHERQDMSICKVCGGIGYHETWCTRPTDPIDTEKAVVTECAIAELSEEGKAMMAQRKADQADLIDWILHYKNPADDETRLRQIRLVME